MGGEDWCTLEPDTLEPNTPRPPPVKVRNNDTPFAPLFSRLRFSSGSRPNKPEMTRINNDTRHALNVVIEYVPAIPAIVASKTMRMM